MNILLDVLNNKNLEPRAKVRLLVIYAQIFNDEAMEYKKSGDQKNARNCMDNYNFLISEMAKCNTKTSY